MSTVTLQYLSCPELEELLHDPLFDHLPEITLFGRVHTPEQLEYLKLRGQCPMCDSKPETFEPLPPGWVWDCRAFTNWVWCPRCDAEMSAPEDEEVNG